MGKRNNEKTLLKYPKTLSTIDHANRKNNADSSSSSLGFNGCLHPWRCIAIYLLVLVISHIPYSHHILVISPVLVRKQIKYFIPCSLLLQSNIFFTPRPVSPIFPLNLKRVFNELWNLGFGEFIYIFFSFQGYVTMHIIMHAVKIVCISSKC